MTSVAVPDTNGELVEILGRLEEVLIQLQPWEEDDDPAPVGLGADALEALRRISGAVRAAEDVRAVQLYASGGTFELVPVRFVDLADRDLAAVGQAIAALGLALLPGGDGYAGDVLREFAGDRPGQATDLVAAFARSHGLLDLSPDDDTLLLAAIVEGQTDRSGGDDRQPDVMGAYLGRGWTIDQDGRWHEPSADATGYRRVDAVGCTVLTVAEEQAYRRLTERVLAMFHEGDPLARFLYDEPRRPPAKS